MGKDHQNLSGEGLILIGRKYAILLLGLNLKRVIPKLIKKMLQKWAKRMGKMGPSLLFTAVYLFFLLEMIDAMDIRYICLFISYVVYHPMFYIIFEVKVVLVASR